MNITSLARREITM